MRELVRLVVLWVVLLPAGFVLMILLDWGVLAGLVSSPHPPRPLLCGFGSSHASTVPA